MDYIIGRQLRRRRAGFATVPRDWRCTTREPWRHTSRAIYELERGDVAAGNPRPTSTLGQPLSVGSGGDSTGVGQAETFRPNASVWLVVWTVIRPEVGQQHCTDNPVAAAVRHHLRSYLCWKVRCPRAHISQSGGCVCRCHRTILSPQDARVEAFLRPTLDVLDP